MRSENNNLKKRLVSLLLIFLFVISVTIGCAEAEKPISVAELLELGEKYLLELNYEQAVVQFLKVIDIEPMNPRGYMGAAEAYIGLGDEDSAIDILRQGLERLSNNEEIRGMLDELLSNLQAGEDVPNEYVTAKGVFIDNSEIYEEQWHRYLDQYSDEENKISVSIDSFAVRFIDVITVEIDEKMVTLDEATLIHWYIDETGDSIDEILGIPINVTGHFELNSQTEELSGLDKHEYDDDDRSFYNYRPNGDYMFIVYSYEFY